MNEQKHFNAGNVFGRVVDEIEHKESEGGKPFISFQVNVSGNKCGSARAYCRIWGQERIDSFMDELKDNPTAVFWFRGFFGQYWNQQNEVSSNFTIFKVEPRASDPRAAFILKGVVKVSSAVRDGRRMILLVQRDGQPEEKFELWCQAEKLLDEPESGALIEVKGYLRQETPEDDFGGSSGPVRAYVEQLKVLS